MKTLLTFLTAIIFATTTGFYISSYYQKRNPPDNELQKYLQPESDGVKKKNTWTIGFYSGSSPFKLSPAPGARNPVFTPKEITDAKADIAAHPFLVVSDSLYYMFFTAKDEKTDMGGIGLAESKNGIDWNYRQIVIKEPFVVSHPCVFKWEESYYLIPEAYSQSEVRLYKAVEFPHKWKFEGTILSGDKYYSPTIFRQNDLWWMFTIKPGNETLRLFYASDLQGAWKEHPESPVVEKDLNTARPAGKPFRWEGKLYRLGMDCHPVYGEKVHAFEITELSILKYSESMVHHPLVKSSSKGWNSEAMHHVDLHQTGKDKWIAVVDAFGIPDSEPGW